MNAYSINQKTIVVTGGGRGIGRAIALACATEGADVVIAARSENELKETQDYIKNKTGKTVTAVTCDVTVEEDVGRLIDTSCKKNGFVYGLICAAGTHGAIGKLEDVTLTKWKETMEVNLFGAVNCIQKAIPQMKKNKAGRIIMFLGGGQEPMPHFSAYAASKAAVARFSESLALELYPFGIFINSIFPGPVNTRFVDGIFEAGEEKVGKIIFDKILEMRRSGGVPPQRAAELCLWLMSPKAEGLYGKSLSAIWDDPREFSDLQEMSARDIYTFRRVILPDGGTRKK